MNLQIFEEAGEWIIKHRDGGLDDREKQAFDAWLRESPQHVGAYLEMSSVWEDVPSLDPTRQWSTEELIARARADDNVVSFSSQRPIAGPAIAGEEKLDDRPGNAVANQPAVTTDFSARSDASTPMPLRSTGDGGSRRNRKGALRYALAASILVAFIGGWFYLQHDVYATEIGEQRSLALVDGSTVELNSRSRIRVRYSEHERRIDLLEGQAIFHVTKNKARPFIVQTSNARVRAVGTAFDVYETASGAIVTVIEGRVTVRTHQRSQGRASGFLPGGRDSARASATSESDSSGSALSTARTAAQSEGIGSGRASSPDASRIQADAGEVLLAAGQQLVATAASVTSPKSVNVAAVTAWTRRSLVFENSALTEVAREFNRYNARRLVIEDPELADFRVSGVFSSVEPGLFLRFLRAQPELVVEETDTEIRISKIASASRPR